jgi:3-oxoacyl-[acyl-carrier protein] reductase
MQTGLAGRKALVTAASRGLGFATAQALAAEGCRLAIVSSDLDAITAAARRIRSTGVEVIARTADVSNAIDCTDFVGWAVSELGGLDIVVNNTRGPRLGSVEELADDDWQQAFDLVLMSAVRVTRAALPALRVSGSGAVVNLTSIAAHLPLDNLVLSNALRPGVIALGKTLAMEAAPRVRVNSILTGRFETARIREENEYRAGALGVSAADIANMSIKNIPLARYGRPEELAAAVVFLASDSSSFITGTTLAVDGGEYPGLF